MDKTSKLFPTYLINQQTMKLFTLETFVVYGIICYNKIKQKKKTKNQVSSKSAIYTILEVRTMAC